MEEFSVRRGRDAAWFYLHGHRTAYTASSLRRQQEQEPEEEDAVALALAPYVDPHYGDRVRDRPRRSRHHHYLQAPPPPISFQQPRSRPRSPSPPRSNKRACIPASNKAILGLKEVVLPTTTDEDDCAICLKALAPHHKEEDTSTAAADAETTTTTTPLRAMPCSHIFHQHCIFQWLHRNAVCPLCRHQLPTTEDEEEEDEDEDGDDGEGEDDNNPNSREGRRLPRWLRLFLLEAEEERRRLISETR